MKDTNTIQALLALIKESEGLAVGLKVSINSASLGETLVGVECYLKKQRRAYALKLKLAYVFDILRAFFRKLSDTISSVLHGNGKG